MTYHPPPNRTIAPPTPNTGTKITGIVASLVEVAAKQFLRGRVRSCVCAALTFRNIVSTYEQNFCKGVPVIQIAAMESSRLERTAR